MIQKLMSLTNLSQDVVEEYLPDILQDIREYANRTYMSAVSIRDNITIDADGKITLEENFEDFDFQFQVGDFIEFKYSERNPNIYMISEVGEDYFKVANNISQDKCECFIVRLSFDIGLSTLAGMINYRKKAVENPGLYSQSLDGYSFTFDVKETKAGYPMTLMKSIKRRLPGNMEKEYYRAGIIL